MVRRTKEEALETRTRLLDAAELLFQSQGVSQTSLQQIAEAAGATRGAIYWHFKDKAALFNAMMERVTLPFEDATHEAGKTNQDPLAALEQVMMQALGQMITDPQIRRVFEVATLKIEYTEEMASVQERHRTVRAECVQDFRKALRLAATRDGIVLPVPAKSAALGLHAAIAGLIQDWLVEPGAFDLLVVGRQMFNVYLSGLGFQRPGFTRADGNGPGDGR